MVNNEMSGNVSLDIYFDYLWPYVYNAAVWLQRVQASVGEGLNVNWKYFSLEQVNNQENPQWKIWEQPETYPSRGLHAFWAAEASRHQGEVAFSSFHFALLSAKHEEHRDIANTNTLIQVAESVGLEITQFQQDISNHQLLTKLTEDHTFAIETLGIWGTPTLVFPKKQVIFLKMTQPPSPEESLSVFTELRHLTERRRYIQEIKRPQHPSTWQLAYKPNILYPYS